MFCKKDQIRSIAAGYLPKNPQNRVSNTYNSTGHMKNFCNKPTYQPFFWKSSKGSGSCRAFHRYPPEYSFRMVVIQKR